MTMTPTIGRIVIYKSKTANYVIPAIISATQETLFRPGVEGGHLPDLSSPSYVHLIVFTPGFSGHRNDTTTAEQAAELTKRSTPAGGSYQEWDIPYDENNGPGTWCWPQIVQGVVPSGKPLA